MDRYYEYLQSDWWKKTRDECIDSFEKKCFCCEKPYDLQVHHLTYEHLGFERKSELVCLCKKCHEWIEEKKKYSGGLSKKQQWDLLECRKKEIWGKAHNMPYRSLDHFITCCMENDLVGNGKYDLENIGQFNDFVEKYIKEYPNSDIVGISAVRQYLNPLRYEKILKYINLNYTKKQIQKCTGFSMNMINKVCANPEKYQNRVNDYFNRGIKQWED